MKSSNWKSELTEDGDKIICPVCRGNHALTQGKIDNVRMGDGVLFYKCGNKVYVGAINKRTILGVTLC